MVDWVLKRDSRRLLEVDERDLGSERRREDASTCVQSETAMLEMLRGFAGARWLWFLHFLDFQYIVTSPRSGRSGWWSSW